MVDIENQLRELDKMAVDQARSLAKTMISSKTKPTKLANLHRDLDRARTAREVSRIMYNVYLAGTGLGMPNSAWQSLHKIA